MPPPTNPLFAIATWIIPLVLAIVFHEIAHGWVANAFGDPTAKKLGRLSPNPIRHVDPIGTIVLPMALAIVGAPLFGWAKPVPVVASRMRNPRLHMMIVALAGPGMNLLLALLAVILFWVTLHVTTPQTPGGDFLLLNLRNFLLINVSLAVFNLLPIPPLDGGHVLEGLLPRRWAAGYARFGRIGILALIFVLVILPWIAPGMDLFVKLVVPPIDFLVRFFWSLVGIHPV